MSELAGIETHPLAQQYPCRVPVWWGRHGSVEQDSELIGVSGRLVTLRIAKNFKRYERWLAKILRAPKELRRPLDRMNSVLWELCDGSRTFEAICIEMVRASRFCCYLRVSKENPRRQHTNIEV